MLDFLKRTPPVTQEPEDDDDELTLRDVANEVADLGRAVDGLLKREQRRDAAERQQRARSQRADVSGLGERTAADPDPRVRLADAPPNEATEKLNPARRALWAQLRANQR